MRNREVRNLRSKVKFPRAISLAALSMYLCASTWNRLYAQGEEGINAAQEQVASYFDAGTNLMYAIGAVVGLVGAVKVYNKWNSGDQDTGKVAAAWFGSCIFLVVVATVLRAFFL